LEEALQKIKNWAGYAFFKEFSDISGWEVENMLMLSYAVTVSSLRREESRGAHFRTDFPQLDDKKWKKPQLITKKEL
jgi:succinate dehydrogenase/fumarate reductase flavoprotein subunit